MNATSSELITRMAKEQIDNGWYDDAKRTINKISDNGLQSKLLGEIANEQIDNGWYDDAKRTINEINDNGLQSKLLGEIANEQIDNGWYDDAKRTINEINDNGLQSKLLGEIANEQIESGWYDDAKRTINEISDNGIQLKLLGKIANEQIENGWDNDAFKTMEKISEIEKKVEIQRMKRKKSETKEETVNRIKPKQSSDKSKSIDKSKSRDKTHIDSTKVSPISINISRGIEIIGGTFVYKVKVLNNTPHRINDIKIQVLSYPNDCLKADTTERTVPKIEHNGGFRSLEFKFTPTHDCVQGVVNSLVTYIDSTETLQTHVVEPIVIKSVCDLLKPLEGSKYEILDIIDNLKAGAQDELTIVDSAGETFQRFLDVLPEKNFAITVSDSKEIGGRFMGDITAAARGKYTNENIGLKITVLDNGDGGCTVHFKACGNDQSMLPTAVEEVKQILDTKALLVMNIMRTLNVIRDACRVDTAHSVLLKLEELKVKIDGEVEPSTIEKLEEVMGIKAMYDGIEEQLKDHDQERICVYCDHLEGMLETGLVKK